MEIDDKKPVQRVDFSLVQIPCCNLIKNSENQTIMRLNDSGVLIWNLCNGEWAVGEIIETLEESFPEAGEQIRADVSDTLGRFVDVGIIELV